MTGMEGNFLPILARLFRSPYYDNVTRRCVAFLHPPLASNCSRTTLSQLPKTVHCTYIYHLSASTVYNIFPKTLPHRAHCPVETFISHLSTAVSSLPKMVMKALIKGHAVPPAHIPKYIMPSRRPWNWPPDWPIATRDQLVAGMSPSETPGSALLRGKELPRSPTVGQLSARMKQRSYDRMAVQSQPSSAQQADCQLRREEMRGADKSDNVKDRETTAALLISTRAVRSSLTRSEQSALSPPSSSEDSDDRIDFGMGSDSSSSYASGRSDISDADEIREEGMEKSGWKLFPTKTADVRKGKDDGESKRIFMRSRKWRSLIGSMRECLQRA